MSRNKDIKLLHKMTGLPYKECRRMMKEHHWELWEALPIGDVIKKLPEIISNTMAVMDEAINLFASTARELANQFTQAVNESFSNVDSK